LRLTLDELKDHDEVFEIDGITLVIDKYVLKKLRPIDINFEIKESASGFVVSGNSSSGRF
jgi:Fe-S cluster assembly iron-binding protein IscA